MIQDVCAKNFQILHSGEAQFSTDYLLGYCNLESVLFKKGVTSPLKFIFHLFGKIGQSERFFTTHDSAGNDRIFRF
jgi:hypothetical protein